MPFFFIDWSRYNDPNQSRLADASAVLDKIQRWTRNLFKFSGLWFGYKKQKRLRHLILIHKLLLCLLAVFGCVCAAIGLRYLRRSFDADNVRRLTLSLTHWQMAVCAVAVIAWQAWKRQRGFAKLLTTASSGAGLLKRQASLTRWQYALIVGYGVWSALLIAYHLAGAYQLLPVPVPYPWRRFFFGRRCDWVLLLALAHSAYNWALANVQLTAHYAFVLAELQCLNEDARTETNLYQTAVTKHYLLIYHRLTLLNRHANRTFSPLASLTVLINFVVLSLNLAFLICADGRLSLVDVIFSCVFVSFSLAYLSILAVLAQLLRAQDRNFFRVIADVVALDWNVDSDYYSIVAAYKEYNKNESIGLALIGFGTVTTGGIVKVVLLTAVVFVLIFVRL